LPLCLLEHRVASRKVEGTAGVDPHQHRDLVGARVDRHHVERAVPVEIADREIEGSAAVDVELVGDSELAVTERQDQRNIIRATVRREDVELSVVVDVGEREGARLKAVDADRLRQPKRPAAVAREDRDVRAVDVHGDQIDDAVAGDVSDRHVDRAESAAAGDRAQGAVGLEGTVPLPGEQRHTPCVLVGDDDIDIAVTVEVAGRDRPRNHRQRLRTGLAQHPPLPEQHAVGPVVAIDRNLDQVLATIAVEVTVLEVEGSRHIGQERSPKRAVAAPVHDCGLPGQTARDHVVAAVAVEVRRSQHHGFGGVAGLDLEVELRQGTEGDPGRDARRRAQ